MKWLGKRLGYKKMEDWYRTKYIDFQNNQGQGVVKIAYGKDHIRAIQDCFPDYDFKPWLFPIFPNSRWKDQKLRLVYLAWLGRQLGLKTKEDWYTINTTHFVKNCGEGLLYKIYGGSIVNALREYRPNWNWDEAEFKPRTYAIKSGHIERIQKKEFRKRN